MATVTPPYFFDEFLTPARRKQPTPRERQIGFTTKHLEWLHTLYYATHAARQDADVHGFPMQVDRLLIGLTGATPVTLAGAFMMSPTPDDKKAVLYTPYGGLELFDSRTELISEVEKRLTQANPRADLLRFLSIGERDALPPDKPLSVTTEVVQGAVMQDQERAILAAQQNNVTAMLEQLRKLPDLATMLDTLLGIMARRYFPRLNQRDTRVDFFSLASAGDERRWLDSKPLREALLQFYVAHAWPVGQTHTFSNLGHNTTAFTPAQLAQDQQRWDSVVEQTSGVLSKLLNSLLQTYWNEDFNGGQSRLQFFARVMSDKFRADLLFKQQKMILTRDESQTLQAVFLPDQATRRAVASHLSIEKVRVHAPFQHHVDLASTLMLTHTHAYLYTQSRGLQVLKDLNDLNDTLLAMLKAAGHEDELLNFLSLDERSVFIGMEQIQVTGKPVIAGVFEEMVEDIAAKQLDNLEYALGVYRRSAGGVNLAALLDSSLDVRTMLDNRLMEQGTDGRWTVHPITSGNGRPSTVRAEKAKLYLQRLQAVEAAALLERSKHPTLRDLAAHALNAELAKRYLDLDARDVFINTYASRAMEQEERVPRTSVSMVEHFITRLAEQKEAPRNALNTWFYGPRRAGIAQKLNNLTTASFNQIIENVRRTFAETDLRTLPHLLVENNRAHLSQALLQGLNAEAQLRRLDKSLPPDALAMLGSVLVADSMTRLKRHGLKGFIPDAFGLTLEVGSGAEPHPLAHCFVLTERGGLDPVHSGAALLWTPRYGYEAFASTKALRKALEQRLQDPIQRLPLLENLPISRRLPHQPLRLGPLRRIDGHLLNDRQQTHSDFILDEINHVLSMKLTAQRFQDWMDHLVRRAPPSNLPRAIAMAQATIHQQALPVWLGMASPAEQILQAELLEQYRISAPDERDYLHGITPMREQVVSTLSTLLKARFPGAGLSPDNVLIPGRIDLQGNTLALTDYALRHLPDLNADDIRPRSRTGAPLPPLLNGTAVMQLVRQLDLKSLYQNRLTTHLKGNTPDTEERRRLFCRQLPWQLLQHAHEHRLNERLSDAAWRFIQHVFDMPDAIARAAVRGVTAIIRPLELIATEGAARAKALGCYLIGAQPGASGPLVMFAPYSPTHLFKEFADETALLSEFTTPGALQDWVIGQLEATHQATYRNLLGESWRKSVSDIRLGASPITGNLLTQLFQDNADMLLRMLAGQFTRSGKSHWDAVTSLLTEGIPKGLAFMAGKLAYPLVVWRSYELFKASAEDLQQHRWQQALKAFACGVAELASLRRELQQPFPQARPDKTPVSLEQWLKPRQPATITLAELDLTAPERTQLHIFENHEVALNDLEHSTLSHIYRDKSGAQNVVPLAGKVYSVKKAGEHWRMSKGKQHGPYLLRNAQGQWTLDLDKHHPRYGKILSRYMGQVSTWLDERDAINVEAVGMRAITAMSSWKAQCINEALNVATYYAVTAKRNLENFATLRGPDSRLGRFFSELFGVIALTPEQVQRVERRVDEVLDELINHTLVGPDSMRFVSGTARETQQDTIAFILLKDAQHKIYLLDRFFDPPIDIYQNCLNTPFNLSAHARATTLIHEISHLTSLTEDLAYLDSMRPFPDLINVKIAGAQAMRTALEDLRESALSLSTPASMLFRTWDSFTQEWEDFGSESSTSTQKKTVLTTTGAKTLEDARAIFMSNSDKRIDTILANADSVAYMISQAGRALDPGA